MMKRDKYLLVKGAAGLGNRILFLLSALLYARLCNRIVIVDWCDSNYSDDGSNTFSRLFCSASCHPLSELPGSDCMRPDIWRGNLDNSVHDMLLCHQTEKMPPFHCLHLLTVDMRSLDYEEDILVACGFFERIRDFRKHLRGTADKLRAMPTQKILRLLIREHLSLHPSIQNQLDEFRSSKFKQEMVGVHVRYTDKRANLSVTHRALKRLLRRNPELTVFLSTDNASVQQQFESLYANVITTPKWFPTNEANMHNNTDCPDRV